MNNYKIKRFHYEKDIETKIVEKANEEEWQIITMYVDPYYEMLVVIHR